MKGFDFAVTEGTVLFKGPVVPKLGLTFKASISSMANMHPPIIPGTSLELYLHGTEVFIYSPTSCVFWFSMLFRMYCNCKQTQCRVSKLHSIFTPEETMGSVKRGPATAKRPKCVPAGVQALVSITTDSPVLLESFRDCRALGRFALRARGQTVAVGVCEKIVT